MYSIRRRLLLVLAAGFAVLIAGTGLYLENLLDRRVTEEFDAALQAKADALVALTEEENTATGPRIALDDAILNWPDFQRSERPEYFQFWLDDGRVLYRSTRMGGNHDLARAPAPESGAYDVTLPDGRAGRALQVAFAPQVSEHDDDEDDPPDVAPARLDRTLVLVVARDRERLDVLRGHIRWALFGFGGGAWLLAVLLVWRALATGLRPVDAIASQVQRLDAHSLSARIALPRTPRELRAIVDQLNALLVRLEGSFERERRFTANVAHELRTPLAELRSLADVGSRWPEDRAAVARFFDDVQDIASRMERLVVNLLLLARCQAGVEVVARRPVSLRESVEEAWSKYAGAASARGLGFRLEVPRDLVAESDPEKLAIILSNLFDNAVSYTRPGGEIRCAGARNGASFRLEVANPAERLEPADLPKLAEPFWRRDTARSSDEHAGLGLSLVSALARLLQLDLEFAQDADGTFRAGLRGVLPPKA